MSIHSLIYAMKESVLMYVTVRGVIKHLSQDFLSLTVPFAKMVRNCFFLFGFHL